MRPSMGSRQADPVRSIIFKGGVEVHFLKEAKDTDNEYSEFRCVIRPGARTPMPHYHESFEETVHGQKGVATWTVGGKTIDVGPGQSVQIPRGVTHSFENRTREPIEFLCKTAPGQVFGAAYFEDIAEVLNVDGLPDFDRLQDVMRRHGLVPVLGFKRKLIFALLGTIGKVKRSSRA